MADLKASRIKWTTVLMTDMGNEKQTGKHKCFPFQRITGAGVINHNDHESWMQQPQKQITIKNMITYFFTL
jgi:hypothetical protein